jgi:hypothetical protein
MFHGVFAGLDKRLDERGADLRDDGVSVGAQASASVGSPISQQAKAGSNPAPLAVGSVNPSGAFPCAATSRATPAKLTLILRPSHAFPVTVQSFITWPPLPSPAVGVGHSAEEEPFAKVRRADRASRESGAPDGIAKVFQISSHSGEPLAPKRACNLFSKQLWRLALADMVEPDGPKMPGISEASSLARDGEWRARRRAGPAFKVFASGELES